MLNKLYIHTEMKRNLSFILICSLALLVVSCSKQEYYNVPLDANGHAIITQIATGSTPGITTLDASLTVTTKLPNAKAGDVMVAEIVKSQIPTGGGAAQNLPLAGTKKSVTVAADLTTSVTYTRAETALNPGQTIVVTFSGATDSFTTPQIPLTAATSVLPVGLNYQGKATAPIRGAGGAGLAVLPIQVKPAGNTYTGTIVVSTTDDPAVAYANPVTYTGATANVPVDADTFPTAGTRYYQIVTTQGGITETIFTKLTAQDSFFFLKKTTGILSLTTAAQGGFLLTTGASVAATAATAQLTVSAGSLVIKAGPATTGTGASIGFVASTSAAYDANNAIAARAAYAAGTPTATADPASGTGIFLYRMQLSAAASDVYYGYIKVTTIVPGVSVAFEYRIGDLYPHLLVIK
ncbi:MAG TPA: hypothetical protein DIT07_08305 [Sphingobacteriaceae bacterium]|nr:hypothetical protein [Sphingobacteriaceae bacterium]